MRVETPAEPYLLKFPPRGTSDLGFLSIGEGMKSVPFDIKRVFWLYGINDAIERGNHAHRVTEQVLICLQGQIDFFAETPDGKKYEFSVADPGTGIYIPPSAWHVMKYSKGSMQLVLASTLYAEDDYFREYEDYQAFYNGSSSVKY